MSTYVTLWKYTKDGLVDMRKTPERYEVVKKIITDAGGKLLAIYGLIGEYDVITVMELMISWSTYEDQTNPYNS